VASKGVSKMNLDVEGGGGEKHLWRRTEKGGRAGTPEGQRLGGSWGLKKRLRLARRCVLHLAVVLFLNAECS
jgi:hypothetical protein